MTHHQNLRRDRAGGQRLARGLGWFSIGLGVLELVATRALTRALGMQGNEPLVQLYGLREITCGIGILRAKDPTPWIWTRVAGDGLDLGLLAAHAGEENPKRDNVGTALLCVAGVTAADIYCTRKLSREIPRKRLAARHDYSNRSGFPQSPEAMRGAARDFVVPEDMRTPESLRPFAGEVDVVVQI